MKKIIAIIGFFGVFASQAMISSAAYFNTTPLVQCDSQITRTLQIGVEGNEVLVLQAVLFSSQYLNVTPNGYFGYQTQSAVRAFQRDNGIPMTGVVGPMTRDALNEAFCGGSTSGITYVNETPFSGSPVEPIVRVISPNTQEPVVYATPQNIQEPIITSPYVVASGPNSYNNPINLSHGDGNGILGTNIVYNPSSGYTFGIIPQTGSVTVTSPVANTTYNEGDTVLVNFGTNNIRSSTFSVLLENTVTGQNKVVGVISTNSYSFTLTKELLDAVCSGSCAAQQGSYRIVVSTPTVDIAGITSTLRATVSPITINRPYAPSHVSISSSKTPVNSDEVFKLYVNLPASLPGYNAYPSSYKIAIHAVCPSGVTVSIAGIPCGQDFAAPFTAPSYQQEIPAVVTNTTWYRQDVIFQLTVTNLNGQVIGTGETKVTTNAKAFNW